MYLKRVLISSKAEQFKCDIQEVINSYSEIKNYAYILHDKDDTAPHYHIYLDFGNLGINTKDIADWFCIEEYAVGRIITDTKVGAILLRFTGFLTQYDLTDIVANFEIEKEIKEPGILYNFDLYSY